MEKVKIGKLSRSLGIAFTTKVAKILERRPGKPGQHGKSRKPTASNLGKQLLEKQKLKAQYYISEKQLRKYFERAFRQKGGTGENLLRLLESRLDCIVLRGGFASTIYAARQLVNHGNCICIEGKILTKPAYIIQDKNNKTIKFNYLPNRSEINVIYQEQLVVELYC